MNMVLPPKRFEEPFDPKYDSIRHLPWFKRLTQRRDKIPALRQAYAYFLGSDKTQADSSAMFSVDERELRDYIKFINKQPVINSVESKVAQSIINSAYENYCASKAQESIQRYLEAFSRLFGVNPRHVVELWEIDRNYYPSGYNNEHH